MTIDATFWVAISFFIFVGLLIYFKIPKKIQDSLDENILNIKNQIDNAEKLKEEAKSLLSEHEKKLSGSKSEVAKMLSEASEQAEKNVLKVNEEFHKLTENRKKSAEEKIRQMKEQAFNDMKNASVKIAIDSVTRLLKNSLDKSKLDKIYSQSIEETKLALKKKSS
tara:strand:- start:1959 stop:2456 length:498 start_codon:yes stop_codon:yes gene_type:complete